MLAVLFGILSGWRGVLQLSFWPLPARLQRPLTLTLAAAEGEQGRNDKSALICPLIPKFSHQNSHFL